MTALSRIRVELKFTIEFGSEDEARRFQIEDINGFIGAGLQAGALKPEQTADILAGARLSITSVKRL